MRQHGTNACYKWGPEPGSDWRKGCRCRECTTAGVTYIKQWERRKANGYEPYFDNVEAREHILWLSSQGVGRSVVAAKTGIACSTIRNIATGRFTRSKRETIDRILSVGTHLRKPGARLDATRTRQLLDELLAEGFTGTYLAAELGSKAERPSLQVKGPKVTQATADAVKALHARLMAPILAERMRLTEARAHYRALERDRQEAS